MSKAKVRFSGEGSDLSDSVKSLVSTAEKTAGLQRSQGYLLPRNDMRKKAAFTLAEVLITLGIIGVVAAMTLPTLIQNYQKRVYVTQLKKSVSVLSNGFKLMMAHDGVTELKDTEAFSGIKVSQCSDNQNNLHTNTCKTFMDALQNTFSGITFTTENINIKWLNGNPQTFQNWTVMHFPDGSHVFGILANRNPTSADSRAQGSMGSVYIDVNGYKNPNTFGRDIFNFKIGNSGVLIPSGSKAVIELDYSPSYPRYAEKLEQRYWRTATSSDYYCKSDGLSRGMGCAARVLEEDAMNY